MRRFRHVGWLLVVLVAGVSLTIPATAQAAVNGEYTIHPAHAPDKCLTVRNASLAAGARIDINTCQKSSHQRWILTNGPGAFLITLVNKRSALCLEVSQGSTVRGAHITQGACTGQRHQQFRIVGYVDQIQTNTAVNRCVGVSGGSTANGSRVIQWNCDGTPNQTWTFRTV